MEEAPRGAGTGGRRSDLFRGGFYKPGGYVIILESLRAVQDNPNDAGLMLCCQFPICSYRA